MSTPAGCASVFSSDVERRGRDLRDHQARIAVRRRVVRNAGSPLSAGFDQPIGAPLADRRQLRDGRRRAGRRRSRSARRGSCRPTRCRRCRRTPSGCRWRCWPRWSTVSRTNRSASRAAPCTWARAAHRIGVLHLAAVVVRLVDAAAAHQRRDVGGRRPLSGERPGVVDARLERMDRSEQRVDRQRGGDVGGARQLLGRRQRQRQHGRRRLRAVDQREPFLRRRA